ncbi:hemerythrin domain-containing protein [Microbulbifer yueqingensis]|uniref:Hemerythrin-like domain-containing protein n=1 Tax=Microbulbifer yueqingensis TaxID=658219 RepID=A0A1G9AET6_9GAMM|nr:hemerythrin domain-containing protein [Microbulbifer yueqingensis]SDK25344.1 Hemerythrin-like domain-containing protein [Microbulbifer yueqingensis]
MGTQPGLKARVTASWSRLSWLVTIVVLALCANPLVVRAVAETEAQQDPTDVLRKEHQLIQKMVRAAQQEATDIQQSGKVDRARIGKFHDFFKNFADKCHHAKEERELFPVLREVGVDTVVIHLVVKQHEEGRILLGGVEEWLAAADKGEEADPQALRRYLLEYATLMQRHIATENEYLWPRAAAQLSDAQKGALAEAFYRIEVEELGKGFHEKYHGLTMEVLGKSE